MVFVCKELSLSPDIILKMSNLYGLAIATRSESENQAPDDSHGSKSRRIV